MRVEILMFYFIQILPGMKLKKWVLKSWIIFSNIWIIEFLKMIKLK